MFVHVCQLDQVCLGWARLGVHHVGMYVEANILDQDLGPLAPEKRCAIGSGRKTSSSWYPRVIIVLRADAMSCCNIAAGSDVRPR